MISDRISALRACFDALGIDGFVVPKVDMFMGEYIRPCDERLEWLSGFTGSAGFAVVTRTRAALFVDSRYTLQAANQCPEFEIIDWPANEISDEFPDDVLGHDPRFLTVAGARKLGEHKLVASPIDEIWHDRPAPQSAKIRTLPETLAGRTSAEKIAEICDALKHDGVDAYITNSPEDTAWLLNIRGGEIATVPAPHVVSILRASGELEMYSDATFDGLDTRPLTDLDQVSGYIGYNENTLPLALLEKLEAHTPVTHPILTARACKNGAEIQASKDAHIQDAIAWVRFWHWLEAQEASTLDELKIVDQLWAFREAVGARVESFETIAGFNAHGAIVHYRADEKSNLSFTNQGLLLLDSGAHYEGATTDITRTLAIGGGPDKAKKAFTLVLNGLAAISLARFPKGMAGRDIDAITRASLWAEGMDYGHGTGHGVGAELSVHEGPQSLSRKGTFPFKSGMIISLEPGFYEAGAYGIRHENLAVIREEDGFMHFEPLTFVPFDTSMIDPKHLTPQARAWLNDYHQACLEKLAPHLDDEHLSFIRAKCHTFDT